MSPARIVIVFWEKNWKYRSIGDRMLGSIHLGEYVCPRSLRWRPISAGATLLSGKCKLICILAEIAAPGAQVRFLPFYTEASRDLGRLGEAYICWDGLPAFILAEALAFSGPVPLAGPSQTLSCLFRCLEFVKPRAKTKMRLLNCTLPADRQFQASQANNDNADDTLSHWAKKN